MKTRRYVFVTEYMGTNYSGWQAQSHKNTICDVLTQAVCKVLNEEVSLFSSGRTDLGVHAVRQYVHFDTSAKLKTGCFCLGVNTVLPDDISVRECYEVSDDFDARKSALSKTYLYKMFISPTRSPLRHETHAQNYFPLDLEKMRLAAACLIGEHDFSAFRATGGYAKTTIRTIIDIRIKEVNDEVHFFVEGSGFLYNMVRIIVGTLVYVGRGKIAAEDVVKILEGKDRKLAGKTMPPQGLYLFDVKYLPHYFKK